MPSGFMLSLHRARNTRNASLTKSSAVLMKAIDAPSSFSEAPSNDLRVSKVWLNGISGQDMRVNDEMRQNHLQSDTLLRLGLLRALGFSSLLVRLCCFSGCA